jgi:Na+-driven multidrug efflux pump
MFRRLLNAEGQSRSAKTVELFGWLILIEGTIVLFAPHFSASLIRLPPLVEQGANYLRLVGLLVSGLGMLYIASGRLNAEGFVLVSWNHSRTAGVDLFGARFRQLSLDALHLARGI